MCTVTDSVMGVICDSIFSNAFSKGIKPGAEQQSDMIISLYDLIKNRIVLVCYYHLIKDKNNSAFIDDKLITIKKHEIKKHYDTLY